VTPPSVRQPKTKTGGRSDTYSQDQTNQRLAAQALSNPSVSGSSMCPQQVLRSVVMAENIR